MHVAGVSSPFSTFERGSQSRDVGRTFGFASGGSIVIIANPNGGSSRVEYNRVNHRCGTMIE